MIIPSLSKRYDLAGYNVTISDKTLALVTAILAILSASPVVFSGFNAILIVIFLVLYSLLFVNHLFTGRGFLKPNHLSLFIIGLLLTLYIAIPFREYDRFSPSSVWLIAFLTLMFYRQSLLEKAFNYLVNIIYIISLLSLMVLILNAFGLSLPNQVFQREIGGYFTSYFVSVKLSGQDYSILGINLYRLNGIFAEPGHFGLMLAMVLFYSEGIIKTTKGKIILLTTVLTLSFGSFIMLFILYFKNIVIDRKFYQLIIGIIAIIVAVYFIPNEVLERFFLDKADGSLTERTSNYFINAYNSFITQGDILFGHGRDVLEMHEIRNSDFRGFIFRYGFIGILLYFILMFTMYNNKPSSIQFLGYSYFIIVFLHRSWFVDYFAFLFFLFILANKINLKSTSYD